MQALVRLTATVFLGARGRELGIRYDDHIVGQLTDRRVAPCHVSHVPFFAGIELNEIPRTTAKRGASYRRLKAGFDPRPIL
jgi:hypothetical protein